MYSGDDCQRTLELVEAYVLGALDGDDLLRVKEHVEKCGGCWECVLSYDPVHTALILSCKQRSPRPELRSIILKQIIDEAPSRYMQ